MMVEVVHIGKAAKVAGVSVDTIRFYQTLGLIKSAARSAGLVRTLFGPNPFQVACAYPYLKYPDAV